MNEIEQKYIIKKIRALKKVHKLKLILQQSGEYEKYKEFFEEYARNNASWTLKRELIW